MSDYIVSARKYRPDSFESLIGQDNIAQTLKNSILRGQLAHAYLFCGPRGVGKTSAARIFAKIINCSNPTSEMEPCGECESCQSFKEGRSYCIHELDAASNNGVDDIKALMDQVQIPPQVGRYSVYIIDEVHMLSQSAFNAFLKTLEEPPAHAIFILCTTEKHKIIPTILSRCQTYDFNRISIPDIVRNLKSIAARENITIDDESMHVIAQKADGAMRDALTIFDQTVAFCGTDIHYEDVIRNLNVLDYEYSFKLVDAFLAKDYPTALLTFDQILAKGFNALHFISAVGSHLRDLLVARSGGLDSLLDLPDSLKARYKEQAARCSVKFIFEALGIVSQCESGYRTATNQRLHIEYALMRMAFLGGVPDSTVAPAPVASTPAPVQAPAAAPVTTAPAPAAPVAPAAAPAAASAEPQPTVSIKATDTSANQAAETDKPVRPAPRTPRKAAAGLSLSSILEDEEDNMILPDIPVSGQKAETVIPSDDVIKDKWKEAAKELCAGKPRLATALCNAELSINDENGTKIISFNVINKAQKDYLEAGPLRDMETKLSKLLGFGALRVTVDIPVENDEPVKIYMPEEKAKDLINRNEEVKELVMELGLDIK